MLRRHEFPLSIIRLLFKTIFLEQGDNYDALSFNSTILIDLSLNRLGFKRIIKNNYYIKIKNAKNSLENKRRGKFSFQKELPIKKAAF